MGDSDEPMTEYEVHSYEAYKKKYQDDIRPVERASFVSLDQEMLAGYIDLLKRGKPRLAAIPDNEIYELVSIKKGEAVRYS